MNKEASLSQFTGNQENSIDGARFFVNCRQEAADIWFVLDGIPEKSEGCLVPPGNLIFLSAEHVYPDNYFLSRRAREFLDQFDAIYSCNPTLSSKQKPAPPFLPWMINGNHGSSVASHFRDINVLRNLPRPEKKKSLSVICSTKTMTPTHSLRLEFVRKLEKHFGEDIDWFGNGVRPIAEKWDGLADYAVTVALENKSRQHLYSEKILDGYLAWADPVYWGAPNISDYFPVSDAYSLDLLDFEQSVRRIKKAISLSETSERIDSVRRAREMVLGENHFLRRMVRIAGEHLTTNRSRRAEFKRVTTLAPALVDRIESRFGLWHP